MEGDQRDERVKQFIAGLSRDERLRFLIAWAKRQWYWNQQKKAKDKKP